jgi:acyl-homoserine lactone acylase PvdQ
MQVRRYGLPAVLAVGTLLIGIAAAAPSAKRHRDHAAVALNVLPPGEAGLEGGKHATDQARLYDRLTPLAGTVKRAHLARTFKRETLGLGGGKAERIERPGRGVRIARDRWGVPHVSAKRAVDVAYGAGWATAEDRGLYLQLFRGPGRIAALDAPGVDAFALALSGKSFTPSAQTEAFLAKQRSLVLKTGKKGRLLVKLIRAYSAGINDYFKATGQDIPPWTFDDTVASAALIASVFGRGGGDEVRRAMFLDALQRRLGATKGLQVFNDLRRLQDPSSPVSLPRKFDFGGSAGAPGPGNAVVDDGSFEPFGGHVVQPLRPTMSNALLVGRKRSKSGHPIMVAGPQVGYYFPEIFLELDLHGGGLDARGVSFPGTFFVVIGRAKDYAWSAMSSRSDVIDQYVETLCGDDHHYMYKGQCLQMKKFFAGSISGDPLTYYETVHGPVIGYATVEGRRVAISYDRSSRGREILSARTFVDLNTNRVTSPKTFFRAMNQLEFSFNWVYADSKNIAMFSSGRVPVRAPGVDLGLPTVGTGQYEWRGFISRNKHPHGVNPKSGVIAAWNNRPARGWGAADDNWSFGPIQRVQLLQQALAQKRKHTPASVVGVMNAAATQDLRVVDVWPTLAGALAAGTPPSSREKRMVDLLNAWRSAGGHRLDLNNDGKIDDPGAAIMDAAWPKLANAMVSPELGPLTDRLAQLMTRDDHPGPHGSAFDDGWYGYAHSLLYCGGGNAAQCRASLWEALKEAGDELAAKQGPNPAQWHADANGERIRFSPGILPNTMRWTNRPTFQQVISFRSHRPRR